MLCYFYKCTSVWYSVGVGKVTCMHSIFFPLELSLNIPWELSFEWAQYKTSLADLKWAWLVLNSLCIKPIPQCNSSISISIPWFTPATQHKHKHKHKNIKTLILVLMLMLMEWQLSLPHKLLVLISACLCLHCAKTHAYACDYTPSESQALIRDFISLHHL